MPLPTRFSNDWLHQMDDNGHIMSFWCETHKSSIYKAYCKQCNKSFSCSNQGIQQLRQHANGLRHKQKTQELASGRQMMIQATPSITPSVTSLPNSSYALIPTLQPTNYRGLAPLQTEKSPKVVMRCTSEKDKATSAELIWAMKVVESRYSYSSCDGVKEIFKAMFPNSVPDNFTMSSSKVSYLVSEGLGPYFHKVIVEDIKTSNSKYTMQYDETTNKQIAKQLDIKVRYWSNSADEVSVKHLQTYLMGHATGKQISDKLLSSVSSNGLPLSKLVMLGSDGPNVSKTVWNIVNEKVMETERPGGIGLVNVGTCNLHVVNKAFGKGLTTCFNNIPELVIDVYHWFKLSAVRKEEFLAIQEEFGLPTHAFLKHVECRWLTLLPAIERIDEQWKALCHYFITALPKADPSITNNMRYKRIRNQLSRKETPAELQFLKSVATYFNGFLAFFQREEPMIHLLHEKLFDFVKELYMRFLKNELVQTCKTVSGLKALNVDNTDIHQQNKFMEIGEKSRLVLSALPTEKQTILFLSMRKLYRTSSKYLLEKLPLDNTILKSCRALQPQVRHTVWTVPSVKTLAIELAVEVNTDTLGDECRMYQNETVPEKWCKGRIDHYWRNFFSMKNELGELKYPSLTKVMKAALVLSHGSADVERGFSESGGSITSNRIQLTEASINGILATRDGLKLYNGKPHLVPITRELLNMGRSAHAHYVQRLEEKRKEQEDKKRAEILREEEEKERKDKVKELMRTKKDLECEEKRYAEKELEHVTDMDTGNSLLREGNEKLKQALRKKDFPQVALAQAMIEAAQKKIVESHKGREDTRKKQQGIEKRKQSVINDFFLGNYNAKKKKPK